MASSLLDPVAQHAADIVQSRGLGVPDRNALMAGVLSQRTPKLGLFSKDSKGKERDLRVFLFNCAIVLLTPNPNEKEKGWVLFCEPIPIEILTLRAIRAAPSSPAAPQARRRSWFLDRVPAAPIPARAKTPPPGKARSSTPPSAANGIADDFSLVLSTLGRKDPNRTWPITLHASDAVEQRSWAQCVSERQEEIRVNGRDGSIRGWGLVPIKVAALGSSPVTCYVDYDEGFTKARLWGTPDGLYEHILNAPNQATAARKILDLPGVTHVLVMDFDERLMIVLVAEQTAYLAPFPGPSAMLEVSRLKKIGTYITHIAAGVLVSQPTPPANAAPSAFIDPEEKRERRKSATLTKPPPRGAVLSGASSTKSEVPSIARKDKDKESVKAPVVAAPAAPGPVAVPSPTTTASSLAPPASPVKSKDKEKKPRRLSDIGIFSLWKRKPEKDKKKDKPRASTTSPSSAQTAFKPSPIDETPKPSLNVPRTNQAATAKSESAVSSLKPSVDFEGPQLTKVKSSTLPMPMRLPSFEFDRAEAKDESKANGNGNGATEDKPADETGMLTGLGRPSIASQTVPSRASTGGSGLGRLARKLTTDSARTTSSKPKELGPPPTIQIALDFPSIAWPSLETESRDPFAASDFLADVQKDIGVLLSEEKVGVISEEPERASASGSAEGPGAEVKETGNGHVEGNGEVKENGNGAVKEPAGETPAPEATESAPVPPPVAQAAPPAPTATPPVGSPRPAQPQHTRFLVLSKSTTLSTTVKLFTVGGLKIEDDGDIGGGRLTPYKEFYMPSQTFSVDLLKSRICIGSNDGFQIVDPVTLEIQPFLDPVEAADADGPLGFLIKHPRRPKARQVFRVDQKFLCCYDDFAFFLDTFGKRAREDWFVKWQGNPTSFAVQYPYLFAFEPEFIEIRHCATGELLQLIPQSNSKRLPAGDFIAPAQKLDGVPNRRLSGETVLESEGSLYALRPL